jgi:hypothetical protein
VKKQEYHPSSFQFEGTTVNHSDYVQHGQDAIRKANPPNPNQRSALSDRIGNIRLSSSSDAMESSSVYSTTYVTHGAEPRLIGKPKPASLEHTHPGIPLEGESTLHSDYRDPVSWAPSAEVYERRTFKPDQRPADAAEDRDFMSETKNGYVAKKLLTCPVLSGTSLPKEKGEDGHIYFKGHEVNQAAPAAALVSTQ